MEKWPRAAEETDAARETRRVKAAFVISGIVWAVLTAMMVGVGLITRGLTPQSATAVASMNTASALVVILAFVRPRISVIVIVAIGWVGLEFLLLTGPVGLPFTNVPLRRMASSIDSTATGSNPFCAA